MRIKKVVVLVIVVALAMVVIYLNGRVQPKKYSGAVEKIRLGGVPDSSALTYIADGRGFFRDRGLEVSIKDYEAGVLAMKDFAADELDITPISEFALVNQIFKGMDLKCLGTIVRANFQDLIWRRDRGIEKGPDLKGKRIGSVAGSSSDFFLEAFLTSQGVRMKDVKIIYLKPSEIADAVINGAIDGAVSFAPYSETIKKSLGTNAVAWPVQGKQDSYMLLVAKSSFIKAQPSAIERLLRAMIDAEEFIEAHEAEARKIVAERLKLDQSILLPAWHKSRFNVRLDQDVLSLMEDEAVWLIRNKLTDKTRLPNYFDFMYLDGLEKIKPGAVTMIH